MKIGTLAARSGVSVDTLRYYEKIGLLPKVDRDSGGRRAYGETDLSWIEFVLKLKATGMPMRDRIDYARLRAEGPHTAAARREILERHRESLLARRADLDACIDLMDRKITMYEALESENVELACM
jgi:DNA-binding transcriptional MerR regulator